MKQKHHIANTAQVGPRLAAQAKQVAESLFGTEQDPTMIPVSNETEQQLLALHPDSVLFCVDDVSQLQGWVVVVPTTKMLMRKFVDATITEKELLERTRVDDMLDALYLCSAIVMPKHRRKGCATALFAEAIKRISFGKPKELFYWAFTEEGEKFAQSLSKKYGVVVHARRTA